MRSYEISYAMAAIPLYAEEARVVPPNGSVPTFRTGDSVPQFVEDIRP